jgi:uncharacterized repeat protein (TIGR01451 family)
MSRSTRFNNVFAIAFVVCAFLHASVGLAAVLPPVVTQISPMFGATAGGTVVTITGSNFTGVTGVAFGANAGTSVVCATANQCTATSPAGSGTVSVRVANSSGTSANTAADDFTYTAPATACTTFSPATNFMVGSSPVSVAIGDFNGDGISDLAVANSVSNNVSILLGTGTGTFGAATSFTVGTNPNSVAIGDFNGDGISDLAVANGLSGNVSILLGTGTGTFGPATNFTAFGNPISVAIGDFNGDGISDLAVANLGGVSILLGTGTGAFGPAAGFTLGVNPRSVAISDFNADGISDLAVANFFSNNVSILLGTGTGTFGPATNFTVGFSPISVAIGDFNGDGISDLAVANNLSSNVSILLGTGTGTFGAATNITVGANPTSVAIGDFNGDGKSDLAVANDLSSNVSILLGTGTGTFGAATNFAAGSGPFSVAIGDFNGDGKSDLAVVNRSSSTVSILLNAFCPPTVTAINPTSGSGAGGTVVTIIGTNFVVGATTVVFGGSAGTSVTCASITQCTATSPAGSGTVDVRATTAGGTSATSASDQFTYIPQTDLSIIKTASGPAFATLKLTYNIAVANNGPNNAAAVVVTDVLPAGVTFVSATPTQGSCSGTTTITCNLGALANGGSASILLKVIPAAAGPLSNTASVSAAPQPDLNSANDLSTSTVTVAPASNIPALGAWAKMMLALTAAFLGLFMMKKE